MTENKSPPTGADRNDAPPSGNAENNDRGGQKPRSKYKPYAGPVFDGKSPDMKGNVYQVYSEQRKKREFQNTTKQLKVFASTNYSKQAKLLAPLFKDLTKPTVPKPVKGKTEPSGKTDSEGNAILIEGEFDKQVFSERIKMWIKEEAQLEAMTHALYEIVWGQCSELMQNRIIAHKDYEAIRDDGNVAELLKLIRTISTQVETNVSIYDTIDEAKRRYYRMYQGEEDTNATYLNDYRAAIDTLDHYESSIFEDPALIAYERDEVTLTDKQIKTIVKDKMQEIDFLIKSDRSRYASLLTGIRDKFALGIDVYPKSLNKAYDIIESYAATHRLYARKRNKIKSGKSKRRVNGLQYSQDGKKIVAGTDGRVKKDTKCSKCGDWGHFVDHCPTCTPKDEDEDKDKQMHQDEDREQDQDDGNEDDDEFEVIEGDNHFSHGEIKSDDDSIIVSFQFFGRSRNNMVKNG